MKTKAPCLLLLFVCVIAKAQSFQPSVIASSGSYSAFSGGSVQWTVGEVVTETATIGSHSLTQGFNQPDSAKLLTGINPIDPQFTVSCYPNPVTDKLAVTFSNGQYTLSVYTITGQKLDEYTVVGNYTTIPFSKYVDGVYMVSVVNNQSLQKSSFKVIKSQ